MKNHPLVDWLDSRTGARKLLHEALFENIPGGARWRYVWGSTLTFCFAVQVITGLFLLLAYSPSSQTAWESTYYIQHELLGGWFLRGLHHYTAQAMTVLLAVHLMQVVIDGAYKAPREVNFWTGLVLMVLVLALSLTGYLLPWDQNGYWASKVATNLVAAVPMVGPGLQRVLIGGSDYGHQTLTRFLALHAGVIPGTIALLIVAHVALFRRHGITPKEPRRKPDAAFWPGQVLRDAVACLAVLSVVLALVLRYHGAGLGAPADSSQPYPAARPEWYFLFLFQFLKYFPGSTEVIGAVVIPLLLLLTLAALPFIGGWKLGHRFNLGLLGVLTGGAILLTFLALKEDSRRPEFQVAVQSADREAARAVALARAPAGIPPEGAVAMLRTDPLTQGPRLFAQYCASCHRFGGDDARGGTVKDLESASDLKGFGTRAWLTGLLDPKQVDSLKYFGGTDFKTAKMVKFVKRDLGSDLEPQDRVDLANIIIGLSAEAGLKSQREMDRRDAAIVTEAGKAILDKAFNCTECHTFRSSEGDGATPKLTGFASREWLVAFISTPKSGDFFGDHNDRMPAFGADKILTEQEIGLLADWIRGEWYEP